MMAALKLAPAFDKGYRIIPSRFPSVGLFDDLADPDELEILFDLEMKTNGRLSSDFSNLHLVDKKDWLVGVGSTIVMAAFLHPSPAGSRFSDGSFGVYYCGDSSDVAIRETAYHRARFLRLTGEKACRVEMRQYVGSIAMPLHDGRGKKLGSDVMQKDDYTESQALGAGLRASGSHGLLYPSVRSRGGVCAALFRPPAIRGVVQSTAFVYEFDGQEVVAVTPMGKPVVLR